MRKFHENLEAEKHFFYGMNDTFLQQKKRMIQASIHVNNSTNLNKPLTSKWTVMTKTWIFFLENIKYNTNHVSWNKGDK